MANYKKMYLRLLDSVVKTIDELQKSVLETEEIYVSEEEIILELAQNTNEKERNDTE